MSKSLKRGQHQEFVYGKEVVAKPITGQHMRDEFDRIFPDSRLLPCEKRDLRIAQEQGQNNGG
jgi:hypothetical protein